MEQFGSLHLDTLTFSYQEYVGQELDRSDADIADAFNRLEIKTKRLC